MYPQKKGFPDCVSSHLTARSTTSPRAALGFLLRRPAFGRRHLVIVDSESLIEAKALFQHGRPDKRRRVPSLVLQDLRQLWLRWGQHKPSRIADLMHGRIDVRSSCWRAMAPSAESVRLRFRTARPAGRPYPGWGFRSGNSRSIPAGPARSVSIVTSSRFNRVGVGAVPDLQEPRRPARPPGRTGTGTSAASSSPSAYVITVGYFYRAIGTGLGMSSGTRGPGSAGPCQTLPP